MVVPQPPLPPKAVLAPIYRAHHETASSIQVERVAGAKGLPAIGEDAKYGRTATAQQGGTRAQLLQARLQFFQFRNHPEDDRLEVVLQAYCKNRPSLKSTNP